MKGHGPAVERLLLAAPEAATAQDEDGWTPLHAAASAGHAGVLRRMLQTAPTADQLRDAEASIRSS